MKKWRNAIIAIALMTVLFLLQRDTWLRAAIKEDNYLAAVILISLGANVNTQYHGIPIIVQAIANKNLKIVTLLIRHHAETNTRLKAYGNITTLHMAVMAERPDIMKLIINNNLINAQDNSGRTPLHYACMKSSKLHCARLLIEYGADVTVVDKYKNTPLHYCANLSYDNYTIIACMISHDAKINFKNNLGNTPLHEALLANNPNPRIIKLLISHGGDVTIRNKSGTTPIMIATKRNISL